MAPSILPHYIDTQRYRLQYQVCIQILLPKHQEQKGRIYIAHIKIALPVPSGQKHGSQSEHRRQKIYQQHRLPSKLEQYDIQKIHVDLVILSY